MSANLPDDVTDAMIDRAWGGPSPADALIAAQQAHEEATIVLDRLLDRWYAWKDEAISAGDCPETARLWLRAQKPRPLFADAKVLIEAVGGVLAALEEIAHCPEPERGSEDREDAWADDDDR